MAETYSLIYNKHDVLDVNGFIIVLLFSGETCCAICSNVMSACSLPSHIYGIGLDGYMDPWRDVLDDSITPEKLDVRQVTVGYVTFRKCKQLQ